MLRVKVCTSYHIMFALLFLLCGCQAEFHWPWSRKHKGKANQGKAPAFHWPWQKKPHKEKKRLACYIKDGETCPLSKMHNTTKVYPGGSTRCMSKVEPEYAFSVLPGDSDRLLIYMEGGGACVDPITTAIKACDQTISAQPLREKEGIFDLGEDRNPFKNFTMIYVHYCSGDLFASAIHQKYADQEGMTNMKAVVDWVLVNFAKKRLHTLMLMGSSAGSLGVQLWAHKLLASFSYERAAVVADSFVCVMPPGAQGMLFMTYQVCSNGMLTPENSVWCNAGNLTVQHVFDTTMARFPEVTFAVVNSKEDAEQVRYYNMLAKVFKAEPPTINGETFYRIANRDLEVYNKHPNFVSFLVGGYQHMFLDQQNLYGVNTRGSLPHQMDDVSSYKLIDWLSWLPVRTGFQAGSMCHGPQKSNTDKHKGTEYCDELLKGKVFEILPPTTPIIYSKKSALRATAAPAGTTPLPGTTHPSSYQRLSVASGPIGTGEHKPSRRGMPAVAGLAAVMGIVVVPCCICLLALGCSRICCSRKRSGKAVEDDDDEAESRTPSLSTRSYLSTDSEDNE